MKTGDSLTVNQLASTYLDDYDGDINKATNKAKFFASKTKLADSTVGETQIGGIIEADLSNKNKLKHLHEQTEIKLVKYSLI